ncbi:hypothetical protein KDW_08570 [Dictyobacter vulcani]|uniref:Uncharacterized protein n=1 Tax=Dictyobacter vulcani TaxID=2607529 RepID=A0A5J4KGQ1_9CHLR|nr:hypothetical protein [Dictyobacter vulcani]GER86695.1 hypothetical protein KDW_08570 [Dictyobacter vulcani]
MLLNIQRTRQYLKDFDFRLLFREDLGWDSHTENREVLVDNKYFALQAIAQKRGMVAFVCHSLSDGTIPNYNVRRKIERQLAKAVHEHFIIYTDTDKTTQIWQWAKGSIGKPISCSEHIYHVSQPGDSLMQKLQNITFSFEEEESITIFDVTSRARTAFDIEPITRKFFDRFNIEHKHFYQVIEGINDDTHRHWYINSA